MYDDIAFHKENPRPGVIINKPNGEDVYNGVPKDYIGDDVNVNNFFAVLLGNKTALTGGGSGKVVDSGPNDHIFIYYADHGGPGMLGMPHESLYANDLIDVLKKKHEANSYRRMVIYIEACESGSMFEGLLPENLNVYVTTASNATENSYGYYCPPDDPYVDSGYDVCLGDLYSVAWIEDSEKHDLNHVTLEQQYQAVRRRTAYEGLIWDDEATSHVMQYGTKKFRNDSLVSYIGTNPANGDNATYFNIQQNNFMINSSFHTRGAGQRDANLLYYLHKIRTSPEGSKKKDEAKKQYDDEISNRLQVDQNMKKITNLLFGSKISLATMLQSSEERKGKAVVDDWECFKSLVRIYESNCGKLSIYGRKYMRVMANMCNAKIKPEQMTSVVAEACGSGQNS